MQDAADASTAFGRIRSFESILEDIDQPPGNVKPQAKKEPKKKNKAAPKTKKLPKEAAPEAAPEAAAEAAPEAAPKKKPKKLGRLGVYTKARGQYKSTPKSRAYSGSYHKEFTRQRRLGKSKETARLEAGVVGRAAAAVVKTAAAAAAAP